MEENDQIQKKVAAEMVIKHINTNIKLGVITIIIPFLSIVFYMAIGETIALVTWIISFIYVVFIIFKSKKYRDHLIQKYELYHMIKNYQQRFKE